MSAGKSGRLGVSRAKKYAMGAVYLRIVLVPQQNHPDPRSSEPVSTHGPSRLVRAQLTPARDPDGASPARASSGHPGPFKPHSTRKLTWLCRHVGSHSGPFGIVTAYSGCRPSSRSTVPS